MEQWRWGAAHRKNSVHEGPGPGKTAANTGKWRVSRRWTAPHGEAGVMGGAGSARASLAVGRISVLNRILKGSKEGRSII